MKRKSWPNTKRLIKKEDLLSRKNPFQKCMAGFDFPYSNRNGPCNALTSCFVWTRVVGPRREKGSGFSRCFISNIFLLQPSASKLVWFFSAGQHAVGGWERCWSHAALGSTFTKHPGFHCCAPRIWRLVLVCYGMTWRGMKGLQLCLENLECIAEVHQCGFGCSRLDRKMALWNLLPVCAKSEQWSEACFYVGTSGCSATPRFRGLAWVRVEESWSNKLSSC